MEHFTLPVMVVKIALAALGSFASLAIHPTPDKKVIVTRFFWGIVGGVIFGQWQYRILYDQEFILWEALAVCLFAWSFIVYFVMVITARTLSSFERLSDLIDTYRQLRDMLGGRKLPPKYDQGEGSYEHRDHGWHEPVGVDDIAGRAPASPRYGDRDPGDV